jgi:probable F420-dependent oxidoreductase
VQFSVVVPSYGAFGDPDAVRTLIAAAEALGYDGAWFADHVALPDYATPFLPPPMLEPLAACGWGLGATARLRFGVDVLVAPYRHPLVVAAHAASLARLSGGRLVLGVGVGYLEGEFAALGVDPADRGAHTDEALAVLRAAWETPAPVAHGGERFPFSGVHPVGPPVEGLPAGTVPLWVGGNIDVAFRRAARLGDGWHPLFPTTDVYARGRATIEAVRRYGGITRPFTYSYSGPLGRVLDRPRDWSAAHRAASPTAAAARMRPELSYSPAPPLTPEGRPMLTGTPEELQRDVRELAAAGVQHLLLRFWTTASDLDVDGVIRQFELFAAQVAGAV